VTIVFDTSVLSPMFDNDDRIFRALSQHKYDRALIPLATDAEIRFGFENGSRTAKNLKDYQLFIEQFNLELVMPNQDTSIIYADLAAWCRQHGVALSNNDLWIAAACVQTGGSLVTLDQDFANLPQIRLVDLTV
jgi:tRNA(fMet)-specific endonuclease VapC